MESGIVLCQPDGRKGCSLCCGLFNLSDMSRENTSRFLAGGPARVKTLQNTPPDIPCVPRQDVRDFTTYICPFQGFLERGRPGCLLHPCFTGEDLRDRSLYQKKICHEFLCPAHAILSPDEKGLLIRAVCDWYLYNTAIADPESFRWIVRCAAEFISPASNYGPLLEAGLAVHAEHLSRRKVPVFAYSVQEYLEISGEFSLERLDGVAERNEIMKAFSTIVAADLKFQ